MSAQFYDNALRESYSVVGADVGAGGIELEVIGPKGKQGRVVNVSYVVTTVLVGTADIDVGPNAAPTVSLTIPTNAADGSGLAASTELDGQTLLAADTVLEISSDGGATSGVVDLTVTIDWF